MLRKLIFMMFTNKNVEIEQLHIKLAGLDISLFLKISRYYN